MKPKTNTKLAIIVAAALGLAACQNPDGTTDWTRTLTTGAGAVGGALIGSMFGGGNGQIIAMAAGAAGGAWLGNELGKKITAKEATAMKPAVAQAASAPSAQPVSWAAENENGEISKGEVVAAGPIRIVNGKECRTMKQDIVRPRGTTTERFEVCRTVGGNQDWQVASAS
jgi:surface antigen